MFKINLKKNTENIFTNLIYIYYIYRGTKQGILLISLFFLHIIYAHIP